MSKFLYTFLLEKLKFAFIIGAFIGLIIVIFLGQNMLMQYIYGFVVSCINFAMLSLGTDYMLGARPKRTLPVHLLFFIFRYGLVAYVIAEFIKNKNANPFVVILGLTTLNISLVVWASTRHNTVKKEG